MTALTILDYGFSLVCLLCVLAFFRVACLFSRECRLIRTECERTGDLIDPANRLVDRLDRLHVELFGSEN